MIAQMYYMVIDATNPEAEQSDRRVTDFVFDSNKVVGLYKQLDDNLMVIIIDGVDIPLVYDEYTYNVLEEFLDKK